MPIIYSASAMERRAIQIAVLIFTLIIVYSVFFDSGGSILDWVFPDDSSSQAEDF